MVISSLVIIFLPILTQVSGPGLSVPDVCQEQSVDIPVPIFNKFAGLDITVDTIALTAFSATADFQGNFLVALATPAGEVCLYLSSDLGKNWNRVFSTLVATEILRIEIIAPPIESNFVFLFCLGAENNGDLWLLRVSKDHLLGEILPVAVGPDTIDDFSVTVDRDSNYYLYCLYVNEHRQGRNGSFIRSFDQGRSWEPAQDFWNCYDPNLSFGTGSVLHCIWRYALTGREIHYAQNRYYGAPARWSGLTVLSATKERCYTPVVAPAVTSPPWQATVWAVWCVARRDTEMLDLVARFSTNGGSSWSEARNLGEMFIDEWWPSLFVTPYNVSLAYTCGGKGANDPTVVYLRSSPSYAPGCWSSPVKLNDPRVNARFESARPRALPFGAIFSRYGNTYPKGVYFDTYLPFSPSVPEDPRFWFCPRNHEKGGIAAVFFDVTGRRVNREKLPFGVYFSRQKKTKKLVVFK